jgi:hypothetical protein
VVYFASFAIVIFFKLKMIGKKNSFNSKITSGTPKFQMAILNQEIKINDQLAFLLVAHVYMNPFYRQWVIHLAIFDFSLACEMLKSGSHAYHYPPLRSPRTMCTTSLKRFMPILILATCAIFRLLVTSLISMSINIELADFTDCKNPEDACRFCM